MLEVVPNPAWYLLKMDDTDLWFEHKAHARWKALAGRVFSVFIFDANLDVFKKASTPSKELHFVGSEWEGVDHDYTDAETDQIDHLIQVGDIDEEDTLYFPSSDIRQAEKMKKPFPKGSIGVCAILVEGDLDAAIQAYRKSSGF